MKQYTSLLWLLLLPLLGWGQLVDDFSDGNLMAPDWIGDTDAFRVENGELQLFDQTPESNNLTYLALPAQADETATVSWELYVRTEFSPSAGNHALVYLSYSLPDPQQTGVGYYLKIGGISGSDDRVELFRQDENGSTLLLQGAAGAVGNDPVTVGLQVTRTADGMWTLATDYTGGSNYQDEGSTMDATYPLGAFFAIACKYTSSRAEDFYFDNLRIAPVVVDNEGPQLLEVTALSSQQLLLRFDEPLGAAPDASDLILSPMVGTITDLVLNGPASNELTATLDAPLANGTTYTATINNVADLIGNTSSNQSADFTYYQVNTPQAGDLIITEFMPDPVESVGLPEVEYVELYNASDFALALEEVLIESGGSPQSLPNVLLLPGSYIIVCDDSNAADLSAYGAIAEVGSMPTLSNSGDHIELTNESGMVISRLEYTDDWYKDPDRADGGYSLELIDLSSDPLCPGNWRASLSDNGGTPGQENSVVGTPLSTEAASLELILPQDATTVDIFFSQPMKVNTVQDIAAYQISPDLTILDVEVLDFSRQAFRIQLSTPLAEGQVYELSFFNSLENCLSVTSNGLGGRFGLPEQPEAGDILINEVLFRPYSGGKDFIELTNVSNKVINLNNGFLQNHVKESGDTLQQIKRDIFIFPGDFLVLTEAPAVIAETYTVPQPNWLIEQNLPSLDSDAGNISLRLNGVTIDSFDYTDDYHTPLLRTNQGVSLERLSTAIATQQPDNWQSAAETAGFATPTGPNSQQAVNTGSIPAGSWYDIPTKRLSPDQDGFEDILSVFYELDRPGYSLDASIYDAQGRLVRRLARNLFLSTEGTFSWDGTQDDGTVARMGIYILVLERFHTDGSSDRSKTPVVVARRLD